MGRNRSTYWIGPKPTGDKKGWMMCDHGTILTDKNLYENVFHLHRRFVHDFNNTDAQKILDAKVFQAHTSIAIAMDDEQGDWFLIIKPKRNWKFWSCSKKK